MATGSKCKYLLYIASTVAADVLVNHQRCAANFLHVLCLSKKNDPCQCGSLLIKPTNSTGAGSTNYNIT